MAQSDVETLNSFLRGEISAVETYRQALDRISDDRLRSQLETCQQDHEKRVTTIRERIKDLGGEPAEGSGPWGVFAKLVEGGAGAFGEKAAIDAIEEGEDHGLKDYEQDAKKVHGDARRFVLTELLPAQKGTHKRMSQLKRMLH